MFGAERFESRESPSGDFLRPVNFSKADNRIVLAQRENLPIPPGFPQLETTAPPSSKYTAQSTPVELGQDGPNMTHGADVTHRPDINHGPDLTHCPSIPTDPALPGLPLPSGGCRQIIHITPARYVTVPYPTDWSIRNGVNYGHIQIQVPGWVPGAHPWRP